MKNKESLNKLKFALEWFKTGDAVEAARQTGYKAPKGAAKRLKADPYVNERMQALGEMFVRADDDGAGQYDVAPPEEVLARLTSIMRGDDPDEKEIVLKESTVKYDPVSKAKTTDNRERVEIVAVKVNVRERLKAAEDLLKHYTDANQLGVDNENTGVVILPEICLPGAPEAQI